VKGFVRLFLFSALTAAVIIAAVGGGGYWLRKEAEGPGPLADARTVVIPGRTGISGIAELLAEKGVIRQALVFELVAKISGRGGALKAGEYEFPAGTSAVAALDILAGGKTVKRRLTIPEGLTSAEVMALVRDAPALDGEIGTPALEGELLPDTYVYSYGDQRKELIERMRQAMTHALARAWADRRADLPLAGPQDILTLASIVEKEAAREDERPHIAGVFINRLRLGMRLQADPTVSFAIAADSGVKLERPLMHADLAFNSPYNTYIAKGLPPGPITNPGKSAIRAAIRPERTEDLYFVADGTGGHVFAKTLADQTRNIAAYRRANAAEAEVEPAEANAPAAPAVTNAAPAPAAAQARSHPAQHAAQAPPPGPNHRCRPGHACTR
jgi:UPF0755 protein